MILGPVLFKLYVNNIIVGDIIGCDTPIFFEADYKSQKYSSIL